MSSALIRQVIEVLCVNLRIGFGNVVLFSVSNFFVFRQLTACRRASSTGSTSACQPSASRWTLGITSTSCVLGTQRCPGPSRRDLLLVEVTHRLRLRE